MKPMNDEDQKRRMAALAEGKRIVTKRYRNPVYGNRSLKDNVEEEMGNPMPTNVDRKKAARMAMDKFIDKRRNKLPRLSDVGNPGKDYEMGNPSQSPSYRVMSVDPKGGDIDEQFALIETSRSYGAPASDPSMRKIRVGDSLPEGEVTAITGEGIQVIPDEGDEYVISLGRRDGYKSPVRKKSPTNQQLDQQFQSRLQQSKTPLQEADFSSSETITRDRFQSDLDADEQEMIKNIEMFSKRPMMKRANETGNPKEDLSEISGQLKKASRLHANQSDRVGKIAKKMKGEQGNPHMKKSKSKYGM